MKKLTEMQEKRYMMLKYLLAYKKYPTIEDIGRVWLYNRKSATKAMLEQLVKRGAIEIVKGKFNNDDEYSTSKRSSRYKYILKWR